MKKTTLFATIAVCGALSALGQARVEFQSVAYFFTTGQGTVRVDPDPTKLIAPVPAGGAHGAYVGANYSAQLLWKAGTFADLASFLAAGPSSSTAVAFQGSTGGDPNTDLAGLIFAGDVALGGPAGVYTFLVRAWYNGGTYPTYEAAFGNVNTGQSQLFTLSATAPPAPTPTTDFPSFTVWVVPEPGTLALSGLGLAALFLLRRRS